MLILIKVKKLKKENILLDGSPAPHDILRILGVEKLNRIFCFRSSRSL